MQLILQPLCAECLRHGVVAPAEVAHHLVPHKGDERKFYFGELSSLCKACHDSVVQQRERSGYSRDIGPTGWPLDPAHPVYAKR
jgi:hypothetical protein